MKTAVMLGVVVAIGLAAAPARADLISEPEGAAVEASPSRSALDLDVKLGLKGFRIGSRIFGKDGYAGGAWLNGETRSDGFSLDGRIEHDGKARNFKFNADIDEWVRRAIRWWSVIDR